MVRDFSTVWIVGPVASLMNTGRVRDFLIQRIAMITI
jgi:hypothetical protein